jgi:uncharacterized paraquat-inducible protein A
VTQAGRAGTVLKSINLALLIAYPLAWTAPLMRAGLDLPLFGLSEISVLSGLASLWQTDRALAAVVALFALVAPYVKTIGLALMHVGRLPRRGLVLLQLMGKLAMADIFLIALYITVVKGIGLARIETAWGLYLFSGCVIASLVIGWRTENPRNALRPANGQDPAQ